MSLRRGQDLAVTGKLMGMGSSPISSMTFSWDGARLVAATKEPDLHLYVFDVATQKLLCRVALPAPASSVAFCPYDQSLVSVLESGKSAHICLIEKDFQASHWPAARTAGLVLCAEGPPPPLPFCSRTWPP